MSEEQQPKRRPWFIGAAEHARLNMACIPLHKGFGVGVFLVGSCLVRRDYRDVDVRCILEDAEFDALFGKHPPRGWSNPRFATICASISLHLQQCTGLPIDFQFQSMTAAESEKGLRHALGIIVPPNVEDA